MGNTHERKKHSKLTLAERVARLDSVIAGVTNHLAALRQKRTDLIEQEAKRARAALDAVNSAREKEPTQSEK